MSLHDDFLEQAQHLARRERRRPRQASLRRAISAAYYSLFHFFAREASRLVFRQEPTIAVMNRIVNHSEIRDVCRAILNQTLPQRFQSVAVYLPIPQELTSIAQTFVDLQQARHEADYNTSGRYLRNVVVQAIGQVTQAFEDWAIIRNTDIARLFLSCFLLWDRFNRRG